MATRQYVANAANIKKVVTLTIGGTWLATETITLTIDNVDFIVTIGSLVTTAQVATSLSQGFNGTAFTDTTASASPKVADGGAQDIPQFAEIVATVSGSVVTLTARTAGKSFTLTSATTSASGTVTPATPTAGTGKQNASNQDNWSANTVPVDGDIAVFDTGSQDVTEGLAMAIQPLQVIVSRAFTGLIGLAETNRDDEDDPYTEYRETALTFDDNTTTCTYDLLTGARGAGSRRIRIDAGAGQSIFNAYFRGTRDVSSVPQILLTGSHASNVLNNLAGDVGVAFFATETAVLASLRTGNGANSIAETVCGVGCDLSSCAVVVGGGYLETRSAIDTVVIENGEHAHYGGTIAEVTIREGGTFSPRFTGTITDMTIGAGGHLDKRHDLQVLTITNKVLCYKGAKISDPNGTIVFSGGIQFVECSLDDVAKDVGNNRSITVT